MSSHLHAAFILGFVFLMLSAIPTADWIASKFENESNPGGLA